MEVEGASVKRNKIEKGDSYLVNKFKCHGVYTSSGNRRKEKKFKDLIPSS